ncbi:MAG: Crp/Fnr family transcriptional regulator [Chloroflexota bacterium]
MPHPVHTMSVPDLLADLSPEEVTAFYARAPTRTYPAGDLLYQPYETRRVTFLLRAGRVRLYQMTVDGQTTAIALVEPGALFGEMPLVGQAMTGHYAEALDEVTLAVLQPDDVRALLLTDSRVTERLVLSLGQRVSDLEHQLHAISLKTTGARVASMLLYAGLRYNKRTPDGHLTVGITHEYLAHIVSLNRETVTRALNDFQRAGLVRLERGRVILLDLRGLREASRA